MFNRRFLLLSPYHQKKLLERNTFLFTQIFIGLYLGAKSGTEQLSLIHHFLPKAITKSNQMPHFINLELFSAITKMFKTDSNLNQYKDLICKLQNIHLTSNHQISILAYLVIFDMDPPLFLNCIETLKKKFTDLWSITSKSIKETSNNLVASLT